MHWKDVTFLGWISISTLAFNAQLFGNAAYQAGLWWGSPARCRKCRLELERKK